MKRVHSTKKFFALFIFLNVFAWGGAFFLIFRINAQTAGVGFVVSEAQKDLAKDADLRAIKKSLEENDEKMRTLDSFFVPSDGVVDFIETLESIGERSGVELAIGTLSTEVNTKNPNDFKELLRLRLEATGSWGEVYGFLYRLESLPYHIVLENTALTLSASGENIFFVAGVTQRTPSANEEWKGYFDVTVSKMK